MSEQPPANRSPVSINPSSPPDRPTSLPPGTRLQGSRPIYPPRLTFVLSVYHQLPNEDPTVTEVRAAQWLSTETEEKQSYKRVVTLKEGRHKLDCGWVENPSIVVIYNKGATPLEVWFADHLLCDIFPEMALPITSPHNLDKLELVGPGKFVLTAVPE